MTVPTRGDERAGRLRLLAPARMPEGLLLLVALLVPSVDPLDLVLPVLAGGVGLEGPNYLERASRSSLGDPSFS